MKIYIASSWKNQHAVEMLTLLLRQKDHEVVSWVENNYGEGHNHITKNFDFETWVNSEASDQSFEFDTHGAMECDLFIYVGPAGKDAAAECGMCYGQRLAGKTIPMLALYAKGEDFGLMRKMFDHWFDRYESLLEIVLSYARAFEFMTNMKNACEKSEKEHGDFPFKGKTLKEQLSDQSDCCCDTGCVCSIHDKYIGDQS